MKLRLISKTLLYYLLISLPLLLIAAFLSHRAISHELNDATDEALVKEKRHVEYAISQHPEHFEYPTNDLVRVTPSETFMPGHQFSDSTAYDKLEGEQVSFHVLRSFYRDHGRTYAITIAKPTIEEEELMEGLVYTFTVIGLFLLIAFFAVSLLISRTLWKPFYRSLDKLTDYDLKQQQEVRFERSGTLEFDKLNEVLNQMTEKIRRDFIQQKEFTENASHEMQTPLAIIKANANLLMQSPRMEDEEMRQLLAIDDTVRRLTMLNKALLLLARIENKQFRENVTLNLGDVLEKVLGHYAEMISAREITVRYQAREPGNVTMNASLAEVLFSNLLQNATRHNHASGLIEVLVEERKVTISNTGPGAAIDPASLFRRFKKSDASAESNGLGLAIVKGICTLYRIDIRYTYQDNKHQFILEFNL